MGRKLNICLHAQTLNDPKGEVAGSEVTTLGLQQALLRRPEISNAVRYGPYHYPDLEKTPLDLVIVEGWNPCLPKFIAHIRKVHPRAKILFWCLSYYGFNEILSLAFDGYMTNSQQLMPTFQAKAPTLFLHLAVDPELFLPLPPPKKYAHEVVYLGHYRNEFEQTQMLTAASGFDLGIYGIHWEKSELLHPHHRGMLPFDQIAHLYSSSAIVLGTTENRQRDSEMINNRIFEALACGACVISDYFPALETVFEGNLLYAHNPWEALQLIKKWLPEADKRQALGIKARECILKHHTYDHRVADLLNFYAQQFADNF